MGKEKIKNGESVFDGFTGKYALSKTLRFELKPVGKTPDFLKTNKVFEKDKTIDDSYNQAKFYFDTLHQRFINSALSPKAVESLDFFKLANFLAGQSLQIAQLKKEISDFKKAKKDTNLLQEKVNDIEKEVENKKEEFYKKIRALLDAEADKWKNKYIGKKLENGNIIKFGKKKKEESRQKNEKKNEKGVNFLTSAGVLQILKYEFPKLKEKELRAQGWPSLFVEEKENPGSQRYIFDSFDRFSGYLTKFQETRKNIYADNGIATALATRIISNFEVFLANKKAFEDRYKSTEKGAEIGFDRVNIFVVDNYKNYLLQDSIEALEGSKNTQNSYNKIIGALNKKIKEYRDQKASEAKQQKNKEFKKPDFPLFKKLKKQILGMVEKERQLIEATEIETEEKVFVKRFKEFISANEERFSSAKKIMDKLFGDNEFVSEYDGIYIKNSSINTISRRWFSDGFTFEKNLPQISSKNKKESDAVKVKKFITLADVKNAVEQLEGNPYKEDYYKKNILKEGEKDLWYQFLAIWKFEFENLFKDQKKENGDIVRGYNSCLKKAQELHSFSKERKPKEIAIVKNYADATLRVFQIMKYVALDDRDMDKLSGISADFYAELDEYAKDFEFNKYYNAFRNYITKKPFDEDKIKLNFEKGNLLGGFAESPKGNAQFCAYILRKNNDYFLAITKYPHFLDIEKYKLIAKGEEDFYEKVEYSSLNWGKNIAGGQVYTSFAKEKFGKNISYQEHKKKLNPSEHVAFVKSLIKEKYINRDKFSVLLQEFIDKDYKSVVEMQKAFSELQLGGVRFEKVKADWIDEQMIEGEKKKHQLYLFQILNRDLRSRGNSFSKNVHTLYWDALFSNANLNERIFDLLGNAEIFFRKASEGLVVRKNNQGEEYVNKKGEKIVEGRRYSRDIIHFHIPISLNYSKKSIKQGQFNKEVNKYIAGKKEVNVIGLDRGEKHLVYYSVVNQKGEILDQGSLNKIKTKVNGKETEVDYREKLVEREKERIENRQSWNPVGKIKDLKKGYVSQVVRKIVDLVIKHNAIVVMEDLNLRFKQIRGGVERSVYQQLEKQLIDKFGYLVFKDRKPEEIGGVLNGYQLSAPFETFEKMNKQTGIIFYTQADYTSVTDPITGFRKNIYISNSASQKTIAEAMDKFKAIGWDDEVQSYFFTYNPVEFAEEKYKENTFSKEWTVYAKVPRIRREKDGKGYWQYKLIDLNEKFRNLFEIWKFDNLEGDIWEQIQEKEGSDLLKSEKVFDGKPRSFYNSFIYLFNLILQLRNSFSEQWVIEEKDGKRCVKRAGEDIDFIASPVKPFFSMRAMNKKGEELSLTNFAGFEKMVIADNKEEILNNLNGDANGAYNIARKGIMILEKIANNSEKPDLYITKNDWDERTVKWAKENKVE